MRTHIFILTLLLFTSCGAQKKILSITNSSSIDRIEEIVEVEVKDADDYAVYSAEGKQLQCQTTHSGQLIFPATVAAGETVKYQLRKAERLDLDTIATGKVYPQWYDDFAWENDRIAFRAYSKKVEEYEYGKNLYGYDIFTKRAKMPVLDILYNTQFDKDYQWRIHKLKAADKSGQAQYLSGAITYHVDHGLGMDYYTVGSTLGSGTAALVQGGEILYPLCHVDREILDRGGLRFSFKLYFEPVKVGGNMVREVRTITLDKGSHFNHIEVEYENLGSASDVVVGIVLHDRGDNRICTDDYVAYAEPKHEAFGWQTYNAVIYPKSSKNGVKYFEKPLGSATGHILCEGVYEPALKLSYYMGAGWNRWGFPEAKDWFEHVKVQQQKYAEPLRCELK